MRKKEIRKRHFTDLELKMSLPCYATIKPDGSPNLEYFEDSRAMYYLRAKESRDLKLQTKIAMAGLIRYYERTAESQPEKKEEMDSKISNIFGIMNKYGHYRELYYNFDGFEYSFRRLGLGEIKGFLIESARIRYKFEKIYSNELKIAEEKAKAEKQQEKEKKSKKKRIQERIKKSIKVK